MSIGMRSKVWGAVKGRMDGLFSLGSSRGDIIGLVV